MLRQLLPPSPPQRLPASPGCIDDPSIIVIHVSLELAPQREPSPSPWLIWPAQNGLQNNVHIEELLLPKRKCDIHIMHVHIMNQSASLFERSKNSVDASSVKPLSRARPTARTWTLDTRRISSAEMPSENARHNSTAFKYTWHNWYVLTPQMKPRPKQFVLDFPNCYKPWSPPGKAPNPTADLAPCPFCLWVIDLRNRQEKVRHPWCWR